MTIEVFVKKPEKVEVLKYDGTNYDEVVKFAGERFRKIKDYLAKGDYIVKHDDYNIITTIYKPNFAKQDLIGSYIKDVVQGVNPNARISLEKLQEFFEVPIVSEQNKDDDKITSNVDNITSNNCDVKKYRKKPIIVEAVLWNGTNFEEVKKFIIQNNPDEIVHEFVDDTLCTGGCCIFRYKKGGILFYDKKKEKDVFKYGKDRLNDKSVFGALPLGYYVYFDNEKGYFRTVSKAEFEAEYEQQDSNRTSKPSSSSLRDLLKRAVPQHIKCYVEKLEDYGFELVPFREANLTPMEERLLPFTVLKDKNGNKIQIFVRKGDGEKFQLIMPPSYKDRQTKLIKYFMIEVKVKNNNWRKAFNKFVAAFPDEIMKNTNHHASLTS